MLSRSCEQDETDPLACPKYALGVPILVQNLSEKDQILRYIRRLAKSARTSELVDAKIICATLLATASQIEAGAHVLSPLEEAEGEILEVLNQLETSQLSQEEVVRINCLIAAMTADPENIIHVEALLTEGRSILARLAN